MEHAAVCAEYGDGSQSRGEVEVDVKQRLGQSVKRIWLDPVVGIHPVVAKSVRKFDAVIIGPGSFYTSLIPIFLVKGVSEALASIRGPLILVTNLLTEGVGMRGFTVGEAVSRIAGVVGRQVDVVVVNTAVPSEDARKRYAAEHKEPLLLGGVPEGCEIV